MCLNPIKVSNNSTYKGATMPFSYEVPCGQCDECRQCVQMDWQTRISHEMHYWHTHGGCSVFLLFTYNDERLPVYQDGNFSIVAFRQDDIRLFLNRLKTRVYRAFGEKCKYKYFICSEYGEHTKRPHYHVDFMLNAHLAPHYVAFIELCRALWSDEFEQNGFLFPKRVKGHYVDNFGKAVDPRCQSLAGSAWYVSKYITKDLSYYEIPKLRDYLLDKRNRERMRKYLPKHWQSQGIGISMLSDLNIQDHGSVVRFLDKGVYNPLTARMDALPRYILDKLIYKKVRSDKTECPRPYIDKDGKQKYYYDRELTDFGKRYLGQIYENRVNKQTEKIQQVLQQLRQTNPDYFSPPVRHLEGRDLTPTSEMCRKVAIYHTSLKFISDYAIEGILDNCLGDFDGLWPMAKSLWIDRHDTAKYRALHACGLSRKPSRYDYEKRYSILPDVAYLETLYCEESRRLRREKLTEQIKKDKELQSIKRKLCSKFDTKYC